MFVIAENDIYFYRHTYSSTELINAKPLNETLNGLPDMKFHVNTYIVASPGYTHLLYARPLNPLTSKGVQRSRVS